MLDEAKRNGRDQVCTRTGPPLVVDPSTKAVRNRRPHARSSAAWWSSSKITMASPASVPSTPALDATCR
ncbi:MAG TPA: hypothetical protein VMZ73_10525 [Acidimicrobiales bacterium]|nr:hypothetical protein [Acidimicrobiales bacterium]